MFSISLFCYLDTILLVGFKLGDEFLDLLGVGTKYFGFRADGDFILDYTQ